MLSVRISQLKRIINPLIPTIENSDERTFAEKIMKNFFGENISSNDASQALILQIYDCSNQIPLLRDIFSRILSQIASEDPSITIFYKIHAIIQIFGLILRHISKTNGDGKNNSFQSCQLDNQKFTEIQETLRIIKKNKNQKITTIEAILIYYLDNAKNLTTQISNFKTWNELLNHTFEIDSEDTSQGVKELENINIKELMMSHELAGPFIDEIYQKYDGILIYSMSLLTMLTGTKYNDEFTGTLNKLLDNLGSSTQIILLQNRLQKEFAIIQEKAEIINQIQEKIQQRTVQDKVDVAPLQIASFFKQLDKIRQIEKKSTNALPLKYLPAYETIFSHSEFNMQAFQLQKVWNEYNEAYSELFATLNDLNGFFDSVIRRANQITAELFSKGFQAAIPMIDIETCEKAGIHIKNLTATSSTFKIAISDEYFDKKMKQLRQFDDSWKNIRELLNTKCQQESSMKCQDNDLKLFSELLSNLDFIFHDWNARAVFNGYGEEVILACRVLATMNEIFEEIYRILEPMNKQVLSSESLPQFIPIFSDLSKILIKIKNFSEMVNIINSITKNLWLLKRDLVLKITEDPCYLQEPIKTQQLIADIPKILNTEYRMRFIPLELKNGKMKVFTEINNLIEKLIKIPIEERNLLIPYSKIA